MISVNWVGARRSRLRTQQVLDVVLLIGRSVAVRPGPARAPPGGACCWSAPSLPRCTTRNKSTAICVPGRHPADRRGADLLDMSIAMTRTASRHQRAACASQYARRCSRGVRLLTWPSSPGRLDRSEKAGVPPVPQIEVGVPLVRSSMRPPPTGAGLGGADPSPGAPPVLGPAPAPGRRRLWRTPRCAAGEEIPACPGGLLAGAEPPVRDPGALLRPAAGLSRRHRLRTPVEAYSVNVFCVYCWSRHSQRRFDRVGLTRSPPRRTSRGLGQHGVMPPGSQPRLPGPGARRRGRGNPCTAQHLQRAVRPGPAHRLPASPPHRTAQTPVSWSTIVLPLSPRT